MGWSRRASLFSFKTPEILITVIYYTFFKIIPDII